MRPVAAILLLLLTASVARAEAPSATANAAFLAANAKKPGVEVLPSGLQYRVLHSGVGQRPAPGDVARIAYTAHLIDGTLVDGTAAGLPATVSVSGVIQGLSEALKLMHQGDRWQLAVPAALAFGSKAKGAVPANQTLLFDLTLVAVIPASSAPAPDAGNPFSIQAYGREQGAAFTFHP